MPILHIEKSTKFNEIFTNINLSVGMFAKYPPVFAVHMGGTTRALPNAVERTCYILADYVCV